MKLFNIEFYTTPDGEVMYKRANERVRLLEEKDRKIIQELFCAIRDRFLPETFNRLSELYSKSERNRLYFEYKIVHRFIRCNCGAYDQLKYDIDENGNFNLEEVTCPLRGECKHEGVICRPKLNTILTEREKQILKLIAKGFTAIQIAQELNISEHTVNRHRENIKEKTMVSSIAGLVQYYNNHFNQ